jgi:hypothetical protein
MVKSILSNINPDVAIFLATSLFAFISWIVKGLVEKPLAESKITFHRFLEKRIQILSEVKTRLGFIAYFPTEEGSKEYKEQLQELLKDGKAGYLNKSTFESVLKISIEPKTDEKLLINSIKEIDEDLYNQISKVQDEVTFYKRFSNFNPYKRFVGFTILSIQYILSLSLVVSIIFLITYGLLFSTWFWRSVIILLTIVGLFFIDRWMKK